MSGLSAAAISIDAPAEVVWSVMTDLPAYGEWNPFILRIKRRGGPEAAVGDDILLRVRFGAREFDSPERIVTMIPPTLGRDGVLRAKLEYEYFNWLHRAFLIRGRRTQTLTQAPGGPTDYRTHERIHGLLGWLIPRDAITGGFRRHAQGLKKRSESLAEDRV